MPATFTHLPRELRWRIYREAGKLGFRERIAKFETTFLRAYRQRTESATIGNFFVTLGTKVTLYLGGNTCLETTYRSPGFRCQTFFDFYPDSRSESCIIYFELDAERYQDTIDVIGGDWYNVLDSGSPRKGKRLATNTVWEFDRPTGRRFDDDNRA